MSTSLHNTYIVEASKQAFHVINDDFAWHSWPTPNKQEIQTDISLFFIIYVLNLLLYM